MIINILSLLKIKLIKLVDIYWDSGSHRTDVKHNVYNIQRTSNRDQHNKAIKQ